MVSTSSKKPAEIFGHPSDVQTNQIIKDRQKHWCPFLQQVCWKQSRNLDIPFGVCSVQYNDQVVATCPSRFLQDKRVFLDVATHHFGSTHDLLLFPEVRISTKAKSGRIVTYTFDYVIVKHSPLSTNIEDFVVVELQTVDTTNTGELVRAFQAIMAGENIQNESYGFGMNWANVWKRAFMQILKKGIVMETWGHKIYWVAQNPAYQRLLESYGLYDLTFQATDATVFMIYDLYRQADRYTLKQSSVDSSTINDLFKAFQYNMPVPSKETFLNRLNDKLADETQQFRLELKAK